MERIKITHIVAMDLNRCIGKDNGLPWRLSTDLSWFNRNTMGKALIFGSKTFRGLPKIKWGNRHPFVVTRQGMYPNELSQFIEDPSVVTWASEIKNEVMICGGQQIYEQTLSVADTLLITVVFTEVEGDAHYPNYTEDFILEWQSEIQEENGLVFQFTRWVRK